jgi:hypothetical protein
MSHALRLTLLLTACGHPPNPSEPEETDDTAPPTTCPGYTLDVDPDRWALPADAPSLAFGNVHQEASCAVGRDAAQLVDLTGDARPDLVLTTDCDDPEVGSKRWRVWPGVDGGFGAELSWALPDGQDADAFAGLSRAAASCGEDTQLPAFFLADMDGDTRQDLVLTEDCTDETLANGTWRVHTNSGAGFDLPQDRVVTTTRTTGAFVAPVDTPTCSDLFDRPAWGLADLDGEGGAEIVVTKSCTDPLVGEEAWERIEPGTPEAVRWPIPRLIDGTTLARSYYTCPTAPAHFPLDLSGSGRPDLIIPYACDTVSTQWTVFANDGSRHLPLATQVEAPLYLGYSIVVPERVETTCTSSQLAWTLDDSDGDARVDILLTASCTDTAVGETRWDLWRGDERGWLEQHAVPLPRGYSPGTFAGSRGEEPGCGGTANRPAWLRVDLDGDGAAEIVVTRDCDDPTVGVDHWRVYPLTCTG